MEYDKRLDSDDVVIRQQAEIEALRTALVASNSESCAEWERQRKEVEALRASHAGQLRNTLAFQTERDALLEALKELMEVWPSDSLPPHATAIKCAEAINAVKAA